MRKPFRKPAKFPWLRRMSRTFQIKFRLCRRKRRSPEKQRRISHLSRGIHPSEKWTQEGIRKKTGGSGALPPLAGNQKTEIENRGHRKSAIISRTIGRRGNSHQISGIINASLMAPMKIAPMDAENFSSSFIFTPCHE